MPTQPPFTLSSPLKLNCLRFPWEPLTSDFVPTGQNSRPRWPSTAALSLGMRCSLTPWISTRYGGVELRQGRMGVKGD